jgi:glycosyltransferase involved in cell wall biosynthesis
VQSARYCDTWVICEENEFAGEIRQYLQTHGDVPGLHFVFVPMDRREWAFGQIHDSLWYAVLHRWHRKAYEVARRLHERIHFDLVHQVTFCGYREPGYLWKMKVPFVWGPIGGTQNYPWRFSAEAGWRGAWRETCRSIINNLQLRFSRRVRKATRKASVLLAANSTNQRDFARCYGVTPILACDVGLDRVIDSPRHREEPHGPLRILWSGLLRHHKALHLLLHALGSLETKIPYELHVLGDGVLKRRWQRLAERTGVAEHTTWLGWLPHEEAMRQYAWADVFVFTSLRDTTGTVVLEALGAGLPVIGFDHQGVGDVVTEQSGIKVPVTTPRKAIVGFREAILHLAENEAERQRLSRGAVERAREYLWSRHGDQMAELYFQVLAAGRPPLTAGDADWNAETNHGLRPTELVNAANAQR